MPNMKIRERLDYRRAFREIARAARKGADYAGTKYETRAAVGNTDYGEAFREVAQGAQQQGKTDRRNTPSRQLVIMLTR
jgi:hypothetical protein